MSDEKVIREVLGQESMLTPSDIFSRQFKRVRFGGYDPREIDDFLEEAADALEQLIIQVRTLKDKNEDLRTEMAELKQMESTLRASLVNSQQFSDQVIESARREADAMIEEAKLKQAQAHAEATKLPAALTRDIHLLEQQRARLRVEMKSILETHNRLMDSLIPETKTPTGSALFDFGDESPVIAPEEPPVVIEAEEVVDEEPPISDEPVEVETETAEEPVDVEPDADAEDDTAEEIVEDDLTDQSDSSDPSDDDDDSDPDEPEDNEDDTLCDDLDSDEDDDDDLEEIKGPIE
jgi:cell division initiation protein